MRKIVIYGAGVYGTLAKKILYGVNIKIECFIDKKLAGQVVEGIKVVAPSEIDKYKECIIYIATKNYYAEIEDFLVQQGCEYISDIMSILDKGIDGLCLSEKEKDIWEHRQTYAEVVHMSKLKGIKLAHVEAVVTQCCNLKCKDCSNLMPYYKHPKNTDIFELISWIDNLLEAVTYIGELRILGGEPFINRQITDLIERYAFHEKIGVISIFTNGTIMPDKKVLNCVKNNHAKLHISDYGIGDSVRKALINKCTEMEISFYVRKYDEWFQFGDMSYNNLSEQEIKEMYSQCTAAFCISILNGKLYKCSRAAHAYEIGLVKCRNDEYIDLGEAKVCVDKLETFLYKTEYLNACKYCLGTNGIGKVIKPAEQIL